MTKKAKRLASSFLCALMSFVLAFSLTACGGEETVDPVDPDTDTTDPSNPSNTDTDTTTSATYTYRYAVNSLPTNWNIHTYQSSDAEYILDYTEDLLYTFDYNDTLDGYEIVPSMATAMPTDVTQSYVGTTWSISSEETWRAVRVTLREDLYFDNGDHITAQDFVDSMELLLNPEASNYRADSVYGGQFSISGAEAYLKGGQYAYSYMVSEDYGSEEYFDPADVTTDADGYLLYEGQDLVINLDDGGNWGSNGLAAYYAYSYFSVDGYEEWAATADEDGYIKLTAEGLSIVQDAIAQLHGYADAAAYAAACETSGNYVGTDGDINYAYAEFEEMCYFGATWETTSFDTVGIKAVDDYTLDIILEKSLSGFYLYYNLASSLYLVHTETYESCMNSSQGAYSNSYGTSVSTYVGFGPYKLVTYTADSIALFERNEYWYGYSDSAYEGQYQTTNISIQQVSDAETRLQMFLSGQLDSYGLQSTDMADYASSDYVYYTDGTSTWFIALNPDYDGLLAAQEAATPSSSGKVVNKTVLTITSFRKALSYSVDRTAYELALDPTGSVAKALFNNMIISDPETGTAYRTTDEAKQVIVDFWGLTDEVGEGKTYATLDDAIAAITGYDLSLAQECFTEAYYEAVELGYIDPDTDWEVQIVIGQPGSGSSSYYNDGYEFLKATWTAAVEGTPFEGRLVFSQSQPLGSTNFASYLQNNQVDVLFGVGWTGSALDPYSLMEAYVSPNYQYDPGWDTTSTLMSVTMNGYFDDEGMFVYDESSSAMTLYSYVYYYGYYCLQGTSVPVYTYDGSSYTFAGYVNAGSSADATLRLKILAAVENAVLQQYDMIPVGTQSSASLKGMRIVYYTEEYVYGVGRGGIKYMTYTMSDEEWSAYVTSQGGTLNYK